jgi:hypothetical protein
MEEVADAFQVPLIWEDEPKAPYIATASLPASMEKLLELYDPLPCNSIAPSCSPHLQTASSSR